MEQTRLEETYETGVKCANAFYSSECYAQFDYEIKPEDAARLFLPPVVESMAQMQMPLPKGRREWLHGFADEQERILNMTLSKNDESNLQK